MSETATNTLDHIVHLVPPGSLEQASEQFRELGFTVVTGGVHEGGHSMNDLVIFADAVYIEIIAFTQPDYLPPRWANKAPGWIDYAFLGNGSLENRISTVINRRAENERSPVRYLPEVKGGRTRQDGVRLEWLISASQGQDPLPFFCGDITPRELRVPSSHVEHPSGAVGVAYIRLLAYVSSLRALEKELTTVIGSAPVQSSGTIFIWDLRSSNSQAVRLILGIPASDEETQFVEEHGAAIYEVGINARNREGAVKTPYGKLTFISPDAGG